jgi:hypothetical protein
LASFFKAGKGNIRASAFTLKVLKNHKIPKNVNRKVAKVVYGTYTVDTLTTPPSQFVSVSTVYTERSEVLDAIPHLVWQITSVFPTNTRDIPMPEDEDYRWKHKWLYLGLLTGRDLKGECI